MHGRIMMIALGHHYSFQYLMALSQQVTNVSLCIVLGTCVRNKQYSLEFFLKSMKLTVRNGIIGIEAMII